VPRGAVNHLSWTGPRHVMAAHYGGVTVWPLGVGEPGMALEYGV
jgi:hypothetical protein